MSQSLPTGGFKWMTEKKIKNLNLDKYKHDRKNVILLEVDLKYPKNLHDLHNDFPLAPEQLCVKKEMLSEYCQKYKKNFMLQEDKCKN